MATDCTMLEVGVEGENGDNEIELSLELSIGRSYKKSKPENKKPTDSCIKTGANNQSLSRSGASEMFSGGDIGPEGAMDLQSQREIQALRRQEARRKREEKLKKSHCKGSLNGDEKFWPEARQFDRVRDRETRDNEDVLEANPLRKKEKIENAGNCSVENEEIKGLNLALNSGWSSVPVVPLQFLDQPLRNGGVYPSLRPCWAPVAGNVSRSEEKASVPADYRSFRPYQGNRNTVHDDGTDNGSAGCSSSAVSDYESSSHQGGGGSSDSGRSNSSNSQPKHHENLNASAPQQSEHTASSSASIKPTQVIPKAATKHTEADPCRPQSETNETLSLPQMPCVSATGNGPNGVTIYGFLYRYSKAEVTIVCVCHGTTFSPAGFVEHAGGIDITHPLKHITVVPSAFGW